MGNSGRDGGGCAGLIGGLIVIALVVTVVYYAFAWPWYLGSWIAVELGASNPSTTRTVVAWIFEGVYLAAILGFLLLLAWSHFDDQAKQRSAAAEEAAERLRAEAAQRAEEERVAALRQLDKASVPIRRGEAALAALNEAIADYRRWARRIETHPAGVPAGRSGPEEAVPEGELVLGVVPGVWLTLPRVDGPGDRRVQTPVDCGDLVVTDHAIRFEGPVRREEWRLDRIVRRTIEGSQATFAIRGRKTISGVRATRTTSSNVMLAVLDWADELPGQPVNALVRLADASVTAQERLHDVDAQLTRSESKRDRLRDDLFHVLHPDSEHEAGPATVKRAS